VNHEATPTRSSSRSSSTREKQVTAKSSRSSEVVSLAFPNSCKSDNRLYTVTYRRAAGEKPEGTLVEGGTVKVKDGMIFNVTATLSRKP